MLERVHSRHAGNRTGEVASYIPELARADPDLFGITVVTADGTAYEVGDTRHEFTIQSISKPLTYALALEAVGEDEVRRHVDVEPSGEAFNSISLQSGTGLPLNPMVNAGAIATASLIEPLGFDYPIDRILHEYSSFAGRDLSIDDDVFESENESGDRNRAIAYLLKNSGAIDAPDVEAVVETYFEQCSVLVDCRDLAVIAGTLASTGVNPVTGDRVLREDTVRDVLSVMASCGMYDSAGDWLYTVGLPAKSGVAGGVIAVLPGQFGIAVFSPPLDPHGNSVRGVAVCEELSGKLGLHIMRPTRRPAPPIRMERTCVESRSRRMRPESEQETLDEHGWRVRALELQGTVSFAAGEMITGAALNGVTQIEFGVLDFSSVREVDPITVPIFGHLAGSYAGESAELVLSGIGGLPRFTDALQAWRRDQGLDPVRVFPDLDLALEWCEQGLIDRYGTPAPEEEVSLARHGATIGMSPEQIQRLAQSLEPRTYSAGERIYDPAEPVADEMLLLTGGQVSILYEAGDGTVQRIATLTPGMTLGEVAMLNRNHRLGISRADTRLTALALGRDALDRLREEEPALVATFFENLLRMFEVRARNLGRNL